MSVRQGNNIIAGGNQIDNTVISGSTNAVSSDAVYNALTQKVDLISSWGCPVWDSKTAVTLGTSGTEYTAPSDGLFTIQFSNGNLNDHWVNISINNIFILNFWAAVVNNTFGIPPIPVKHGDKLKIEYGANITGAPHFYFVPIEKSN